MKVMINQSNYIPWKGFFDAIASVDTYVVYDEVQYTRRDWRNRNKIKTVQGVQWLTIPVEVKGEYHQKISSVRIAEANWAKTHWKTISQSYAKAPYFKDFRDGFEELYLGKEEKFLSEVNLKFTQHICGLLGIRTQLRSSADFSVKDERTEKLLQICGALKATDYISGPAARDYIEPEQFRQAGVRLHYFNYSGYEEYPQLHGEFDHAVSVLDTLFMTGPKAMHYVFKNAKVDWTRQLDEAAIRSA